MATTEKSSWAKPATPMDPIPLTREVSQKVARKIEKYSFSDERTKEEYQAMLQMYQRKEKAYYRVVKEENKDANLAKSMQQIDDMLTTVRQADAQTNLSSVINTKLQLSKDLSVPLLELFPELSVLITKFNKDISLSFEELATSIEAIVHNSKSVLFLTLFHKIAETNHPQKKSLLAELKKALQDEDEFSGSIFETFDHYTQLIELASLSDSFVQTKRSTGTPCGFRQAWAESCLFLQQQGMNDVLVEELFHDVLSVENAEELSRKLRDSFTDWVLTATENFDEYSFEIDEEALKKKQRWRILFALLTLLPVGLAAANAGLHIVDALTDIEGLNGERLFDFDLIPDRTDDQLPIVNQAPSIDPITGLLLNPQSGLTLETIQNNFLNMPAPSIENAFLDPNLPFTIGSRVTDITNPIAPASFMSSANTNLNDFFEGSSAVQTAEEMFQNSRILVGEFRGDWQNTPEYMNSLSYNGLYQYGIAQLHAPESNAEGVVLPSLEYSDQTTLQYIDFKNWLNPDQFFVLTHPLNRVPNQGSIHVLMDQSYVGSYPLEVICMAGNCFGKPVLRPEDATWIQENATNLSFEIALSYTSQSESSIPIEAIDPPLVEEPLLSLEDLPNALQQQVTMLINDTSISQIERLNLLADWYKTNITATSYSFDPRNHQAWYIAPYEWESDIERERAFFRLFFGTNRAELGLADSPFPILYAHECNRATASFMHTAHLLLWGMQENGETIQVQIQQNSGYLLNGLYGQTGNNVPQSAGHAFSSAVDLLTGQEINLDVTGRSLDEFTRDVYGSLDSSQIDADEARQALPTAAETNPNVTNYASDEEIETIMAITEGRMVLPEERRYQIEYGNSITSIGNIAPSAFFEDYEESASYYVSTRINASENIFWVFDGRDTRLRTSIVYNVLSNDFELTPLDLSTANHFSFNEMQPLPEEIRANLRLETAVVQIPAGTNIIPLDFYLYSSYVPGLSVTNTQGSEIPYTLFDNSAVGNYVIVLDAPISDEPTMVSLKMLFTEEYKPRTRPPALNTHDEFFENSQNYNLSADYLNHLYFYNLQNILTSIRIDETNLDFVSPISLDPYSDIFFSQIETVITNSTNLDDRQKELLIIFYRSMLESKPQDQVAYLEQNIDLFSQPNSVIFDARLLDYEAFYIVIEKMDQDSLPFEYFVTLEFVEEQIALHFKDNPNILFTRFPTEDSDFSLFPNYRMYAYALQTSLFFDLFGQPQPIQLTKDSSVYTVCQTTTSSQNGLTECLAQSPVLPEIGALILTEDITQNMFSEPYLESKSALDLYQNGRFTFYNSILQNDRGFFSRISPYNAFSVEKSEDESSTNSSSTSETDQPHYYQQIVEHIEEGLEDEKSVTTKWIAQYLLSELAKLNPKVLAKFSQLFLPLAFLTLAGRYGLSETLTRWKPRGKRSIEERVRSTFSKNTLPENVKENLTSTEIQILNEALQGKPANNTETRSIIRKAALQKVAGKPQVSFRASPEILDTTLRIDQIPATVILYLEDYENDIGFLETESNSVSKSQLKKALCHGVINEAVFKSNIYSENKKQLENETWKKSFSRTILEHFPGQKEWWYQSMVEVGFTIWNQLIKDWQ